MEGSIIEGVIEAPEEKSAVEKLKNTGVIPLKLAAPKEETARRFWRRSAKGDVLTFTTEMSALLSAGLPLDRSLNILSDISESKEMKSIVQSILKSIREGSAFSDALQRHPKIFSKLYVSMIRAGEVGGVLDVVLDKLGEFLETSKELKDHVISAMIYPIDTRPDRRRLHHCAADLCPSEILRHIRRAGKRVAPSHADPADVQQCPEVLLVDRSGDRNRRMGFPQELHKI